MISRFAWLLLGLILAGCASPVSARHGINLALVACPMGSGLGDGCPATISGWYKQPTFFTGYAQQSGQTWVAPRPAWNVAGVDYPVGPPPGTVFLDAGVQANLPSGCIYAATGSSNSTPQINCGNYSGNPTSLDFENLDFSGRPSIVTSGTGYQPNDTINLSNGAILKVLTVSGGAISTFEFSNPPTSVVTGVLSQTATSGSGTGASFRFTHGAIIVSLAASHVYTTATIKFNNCYFILDTASVSTNGVDLVYINEGSPRPLLFTNNYLNGFANNLANRGGPSAAVGPLGAITSAIIQYNAFINIPARVVGGTVNGIFQFDHNMVDGWMMAATSIHGEIAIVLPSSGTVPLHAYQWNAILIPSSAQGIFQAPFYISNGSAYSSGPTLTDTKIDHNVIITNAYGLSNPKHSTGTGNLPTSVTIAAFSDANYYGAAEINNNYIDSTGSIGFIVTCNTKTGNIAWQTRFSSPVAYANNVELDNLHLGFTMATPSTTLTNGGHGFAVNDTVSFPGVTITVTSVDGSGSILTYTDNYSTYLTTYSAQTATSGSGAGAVLGPSCTGY